MLRLAEIGFPLAITMAALAAACDAPEQVPPTEPEVARTEQASSAEGPSAADEIPGDATPVEGRTASPNSAESPPEPASAEVVKPLPAPQVSEFEQLVATLAGLEVEALPKGGETELEQRYESEAWKHYREKDYERAGRAFGLLALVDRTPWKHPYNLACCAAQRGLSEDARIALAEAFARGGEAVKRKARRDSDLDPVRREPWFTALSRETPTDPTPAKVEMPVVHIDDIVLAVVERGRGLALRADYTVRVETPVKDYAVLVVRPTCKVGGEYRTGFGMQIEGEAILEKHRVGRRATGAALMFFESLVADWVLEDRSWPCEVAFFVMSGGQIARVAEACLELGSVKPGRCPSFVRPTVSVPAEVARVGAEIQRAVGPASLPARWHARQEYVVRVGTAAGSWNAVRVRTTCRVASEDITSESSSSSSFAYAAAGEMLRMDFLSPYGMKAEPEWCQSTVLLGTFGENFEVVDEFCMKADTASRGKCTS